MSDVKVTVGGAIEDEAKRRFVDAWHRVAQGEAVRVIGANQCQSVA